jgi:cyanophycinase
VGGDELHPGNEPQDTLLAAAAGDGPAYVVATAAARHRPELAVAHARAWFSRFELEVVELPVRNRTQARSQETAELAAQGRFFYLVGGDPGLVAQVLRGSAVWKAMFEAWRDGAALAGSSAGAMALCSDTLVRASWPNRFNRRPIDALGLLPKTAVLPHFDTFGHRWVESAQAASPGMSLLGIDERSAAVWDGARWLAAGPGAVTVINRAKVARFASGQEVTGLRRPASMLPKQ